MFKLTALLVCALGCVAHGWADTKAYVLSNTERLEKLIAKKKDTKAPFGLSEIFSEHVEDVNKLLTELKDDNFESSKSDQTKQEVVNRIAKHMEILQKLLSIMSNHAPAEALNKFCNSGNGLFHDAICHRPVRKKYRPEEMNTDSRPMVTVSEKCARTGNDHCECEERMH